MMPIEYMPGGKIYITSADGTSVLFDQIKEAVLHESDPPDKDTFEMNFADPGEIHFNIKLTDEFAASLLGFKNVNCYHRYIRRMKRWKEKYRRMYLKKIGGK